MMDNDITTLTYLIPAHHCCKIVCEDISFWWIEYNDIPISSVYFKFPSTYIIRWFGEALKPGGGKKHKRPTNIVQIMRAHSKNNDG